MADLLSIFKRLQRVEDRTLGLCGEIHSIYYKAPRGVFVVFDDNSELFYGPDALVRLSPEQLTMEV